MNKTDFVRKLILCAGIFGATVWGGFVFAEETSSEENSDILLPDLTTVVQSEGGNISAKNDLSVYEDFSIPSGTGELNVELPQVEIQTDAADIQNDSNASAKDVFAEGRIGGGLPGLFLGDFSVYRIGGNSPFKISFSNESYNGYAFKPLTDGFYDSSTFISADKTISHKNFTFKFGGVYESLGNGLQGTESAISSVNQRNYNGNVSFGWKLPKGFELDSSLAAGGYNRFLDILPHDEDMNISPWAAQCSTFSLAPSAGISFSHSSGFGAFFRAGYDLQTDAEKVLVQGEKSALHRGEFKIGLGWKNDYVNIFADAAAVVGNLIGQNYVVLPFTVGINSNIPVSFSSRRVKLNVSGGFDSHKNTVSELEMANAFSALSFLPAETSDWFAKIQLDMPIKNSFSLNLDGEFKKTAVGNGFWQPVYEDAYLTNGCYCYESFDRLDVNTRLAFSYTYKIFSVAAGWLSYWAFVPYDKDSQCVTLDLAFQSSSSSWGVNLNSVFGIVTEDYIPRIGLEAFVKLTTQVRIAVNMKDVVKLFQGESRTSYGRYCDRGGSAALLVKFFF